MKKLIHFKRKPNSRTCSQRKYVTENKNDSVKDEFYSCLECVFNSLPVKHMKVLSGVFNPKIGKDVANCAATGGHCFHDIVS